MPDENDKPDEKDGRTLLEKVLLRFLHSLEYSSQHFVI